MTTAAWPGYWELVRKLEQGEPVRLSMSEEEFLEWADGETRAEWIDGEVIIMSPPSIEHGDLNGWLAAVLRTYVEQKNLGRVLGPEAPIRLALEAGGVRRRVPDLLFVHKDRAAIIQKNHIEGPPDLIIEIVSPESLSRDLREKYLEYEAAGVREYWVIDPNSQVIEASSLGADGKYVQIAMKDDRINSTVVPGWFVKPAWLWSQPRAKVLDVLPDLGIR